MQHIPPAQRPIQFLDLTVSHSGPNPSVLQALKDILRFKLIPSLTGRDIPGNLETRFMALPSWLDDLGHLAQKNHKEDFENSVSFITPLVTLPFTKPVIGR